jgi:anti-sigma regulatory factor (Ser/Thr protein kinase)
VAPVVLKVEDNSRAPEARNAARNMARSLGFDESSAERAAIVTTEACTNLLKHAGGGTIVLTANDQLGIELLALDSGPGMANLRECLADGYSTTGTSGNGLGAIRRLSAFSDAYSQPGRGTVIFALIANQALIANRRMAVPSPRICGVQAPKPGQEVCGDAWGCRLGESHSMVVLADGLGHGPDAAVAAREALEIFYKHPGASPKELLELVHLGLRHTRGAAVSIASLDEERRLVVFAGLGNVAGFVCERGGLRRQLVSMNGTAGGDARAVFREFSYPWPQGAAVVMHSDGLTSHWNLSDCPGLISCGPALISGVLFRDFRRSTDDATVVTIC